MRLVPGLGCWSGLTKEEHAAGQAWFSTALKVSGVSSDVV